MKSNRSFTFDELMTGNRSEEFIESFYEADDAVSVCHAGGEDKV